MNEFYGSQIRFVDSVVEEVDRRVMSVRRRSLAVRMLLATCLTIFLGIGCGLHQGDFIGTVGVYNYSPSVILEGQVTKYWWCGQATNPAKHSQKTDTIQYESVDAATKKTEGPLTVLAETPGSWDSVFLCNPSVIEGSFNNPLGDGLTYQYAMYYVATNDGATNNIGVAFSTDGIHWKKYPQPVIRTNSPTGYGVGQPALYNVDQKAGIRIFYEDYNSTVHHVAAISSDGVHFTVQGTLTTIGLDPDNPNPNWGDMAFDAKTGYWYAAFNMPLRDPSTTGGVAERGQLGAELYRIPDAALLNGSVPWQELYAVDTNRTGFESNFIAAILHDAYGNVNVGAYPAIQMFLAISHPPPSWDASPKKAAQLAEPNNWVIQSETWDPNNSLLPFYRYLKKDLHEVTTGWIDPTGGFVEESVLGHLYQSPQQGASLTLYGCKQGNTDYFVSLDSACEGQRVLGKDGYGYPQPVAGLNLVALYRCSTGHDHFVSHDPKCEGETTDKLLGYAVP